MKYVRFCKWKRDLKNLQTLRFSSSVCILSKCFRVEHNGFLRHWSSGINVRTHFPHLQNCSIHTHAHRYWSLIKQSKGWTSRFTTHFQCSISFFFFCDDHRTHRPALRATFQNTHHHFQMGKNARKFFFLFRCMFACVSAKNSRIITVYAIWDFLLLVDWSARVCATRHFIPKISVYFCINKNKQIKQNLQQNSLELDA